MSLILENIVDKYSFVASNWTDCICFPVKSSLVKTKDNSIVDQFPVIELPSIVGSFVFLFPCHAPFSSDLSHSRKCTVISERREMIPWERAVVRCGSTSEALKHSPSNVCRLRNILFQFKCLPLHRHRHRSVFFFDYITQYHNIATRAFSMSCSTKVARVSHEDFDNNCVFLAPLFQGDAIFLPRDHGATFHSMVDRLHPFLYNLMFLYNLARLQTNCWNKFLILRKGFYCSCT